MKNFIAFLVLLVSLESLAQHEITIEEGIDNLFEEWNAEDHPGGIVGVMLNDELLYAKAFGEANLTHGIKNDTSTLFNIASISKQFTAMGIVRLHEQGLLNIDDEIQKYLPTVPYFQEKITIRQLMHHTSGLRSLHGLVEMAGWRKNDPRTTDDLFRLMELQKELNFKPGEEFLYCNTGYMFMARIIENVTEQNFIYWTKKNIFEPLGMYNTYVEEDYANIVKNNADSYYASNGAFKKAIPFWGYLGSGNGHTTVSDLLRWYNNFTHPQKGWETAFEVLMTQDTLNNGELNTYAFGIQIDSFMDYKRIQHGGGIGGYRSFACSYPEADLKIVVLTNFNSSDVRGKVGAISEMLLERKSSDLAKHEWIERKVSPKKLTKFEGSYWNDKESFSRKIYLKNDTLWYSRSSENESALIPCGEESGLFRMNDGNHFIVKFDVSNEKNKMIVGFGESDAGYFEEYSLSFPSDRDLGKYVGEYYCPELKVTYTFVLDKSGVLYAEQIRLGKLSARWLKKDIFQVEWPLSDVRFERNEFGELIGFRASNGRVKNVWFQKVVGR